MAKIFFITNTARLSFPFSTGYDGGTEVVGDAADLVTRFTKAKGQGTLIGVMSPDGDRIEGWVNPDAIGSITD